MLATTMLGIDFFFSSRRRHTRCSRDWSSDVCSSDLEMPYLLCLEPHHNLLRSALTIAQAYCIYESCQASSPTPCAATTTGASSSPIAISTAILASASCVISAPPTNSSSSSPKLRDGPCALKGGISVPLRPSGTWLGSSTCCAASTPRPPNESKDLRWASTCFSPP